MSNLADEPPAPDIDPADELDREFLAGYMSELLLGLGRPAGRRAADGHSLPPSTADES